MSGMNRRDFLYSTAGAATLLGGLGTGSVLGAESIPRPPQVPLGKTGITVSRIAQGTGMRGGNRQSNHTRMGFEKLVGLFRHAYDRGVTFFDLADLYGSHVYFREALRSIPRDKVQILSKLWWRYDGRQSNSNPAEYLKKSARMAIERFRHELTTDYIDVLLLHCLSSGDWDKNLEPYMEVLAEAKEKGQIRAVGISSHNIAALKTAAKCPWVDVVLARINPKGQSMDGPVDKVVPVLRDIKKSGKAIIGMKVYGEGKLVHMKDECMKFAQGLGLLDAMTIGGESVEHLDDNLRLLSKYPAAKII